MNTLTFVSTLSEALKKEGANSINCTKLPKTSSNPEGKGFIFTFGTVQGYCSDKCKAMLDDPSVGVEKFSLSKVETDKGMLNVLSANINTTASRALI